MSDTIGELSETRGEVEVEWRIADFFSLSQKVEEWYQCPGFYFSGASWYMRIHPNGQSVDNTTGKIGVYLMRGDYGPPVNLAYTLGLKTADGKKHEEREYTYVFNQKNRGYGARVLLTRSQLLEKKSELAPSDVLTIACCMKNSDPEDIQFSLLTRLQKVSTTLKEILKEKKQSDVVLKAGESQFSAHRMILESQSSVFSAMFRHDMEEKRTGVVDIKDVVPDVFESLLSFMYCGEVENMPTEKVLEVYAAAEKYDLSDLKRFCKAIVRKTLSPEEFCRVIKFAVLYKDEELERDAREYFEKNPKEIVETDAWKTFRVECQEIALSLLESLLYDRFFSTCPD